MTGYKPGESDHSEWRIWPIPDYLNDLNAMHEAEKTLTDHTGYVLALKQVTGEYLAPFFLINATATRRAEAFLRKMNLWKE